MIKGPTAANSDQALDLFHRATCEMLRNLDDQYQMICGRLDELQQDMEEYDKRCPVCL